MYALRVLKSQPLRMALTIGGVALCILLMLFLLAVYQGVADGSVEYIRENRVDLWVLQENSWNILRGSSLLSTGHGVILRDVRSVQSATPILLLLPGIKFRGQVATVFLAGYDPAAGIGGPPRIVKGRGVMNDDEIVLDRAFMRKLKVGLGDRVQIRDDTLRIVGISSGTNAFVIQYAFVTLRRAQSLVGFPGLVTCYLVSVRRGVPVQQAIADIRDELPGVEVYDHEAFLQNNIREMQSGFLPLLYTIAALGAVVLTAVLSLLLSISILERRKDFAVMKILGSPRHFLTRLIVEQGLLIAGAGSAVALILFYPMCLLVEAASRVLTPRSSLEQIGVVVLVAVVIGLLSSFISLQRLRRIYPLEAFA